MVTGYNYRNGAGKWGKKSEGTDRLCTTEKPEEYTRKLSTPRRLWRLWSGRVGDEADKRLHQPSILDQENRGHQSPESIMKRRVTHIVRNMGFENPLRLVNREIRLWLARH